MKIAVTSTGNTMDAGIDPRFGRCSYFVVYDTESKVSEFIQNPNKDANEGAGPASVQLLASRKVGKVVSGEFGMKIKPLLDSLKIQMITIKETDTKISQIIDMLNH